MILKGGFLHSADVERFTYNSAGIKRQLMRTGDIETFSSSVFLFILSFSTAVIDAAPREAASRAIIPDPVKISREDKPDKSPRQANTDSLILSILGLISPSGTETILPAREPPVILIIIADCCPKDR